MAVALPEGEPWRVLFAETPGRVVVSCPPAHLDDLSSLAHAHDVPASHLGAVGGDDLDLGCFALSLEDVRERFESGLPEALSSTMP
jgi:phosphoribosylformylglycinamidine synthase